MASFKDLSQPGLSVAVCAPRLPCGSATERVEQITGVRLNPVSEESRVDDVLQKVIAGRADAGVAYVSDAIGAGSLITAVPFAEAAGVVITYPIAVLKQSKNSELAHKFVDMVSGQTGQQILSTAGFAKP